MRVTVSAPEKARPAELAAPEVAWPTAVASEAMLPQSTRDRGAACSAKRVPRGSPPGDRRGSPSGEAASGGAPRPPRALVRNRARGPEWTTPKRERQRTGVGRQARPPPGRRTPFKRHTSVFKVDIKAARSDQMFRDEGAPFDQGLPYPL